MFDRLLYWFSFHVFSFWFPNVYVTIYFSKKHQKYILRLSKNGAFCNKMRILFRGLVWYGFSYPVFCSFSERTLLQKTPKLNTFSDFPKHFCNKMWLPFRGLVFYWFSFPVFWFHFWCFLKNIFFFGQKDFEFFFRLSKIDFATKCKR